MKNILTLILIALWSFAPYQAESQTVDKEATYKLSGKARRGKLAHEKQVTNGDYELYYITKSTSKKGQGAGLHI